MLAEDVLVKCPAKVLALLRCVAGRLVGVKGEGSELQLLRYDEIRGIER